MLLKIVEDALNRSMDELGPPLPERRVKPHAEAVVAEIMARLPMIIGTVGLSDKGLDSITFAEMRVNGSLLFTPEFSQTKLDKGLGNLENGQQIPLLLVPPATKLGDLAFEGKPKVTTGVFIPIPAQPAPKQDGWEYVCKIIEASIRAYKSDHLPEAEIQPIAECVTNSLTMKLSFVIKVVPLEDFVDTQLAESARSPVEDGNKDQDGNTIDNSSG